MSRTQSEWTPQDQIPATPEAEVRLTRSKDVMPTKPTDKLITTAQAAELLSLAPNTITENYTTMGLTRKELLPGRQRPTLRWLESDVLRYKAERMAEAGVG